MTSPAQRPSNVAGNYCYWCTQVKNYSQACRKCMQSDKDKLVGKLRKQSEFSEAGALHSTIKSSHACLLLHTSTTSLTQYTAHKVKIKQRKKAKAKSRRTDGDCSPQRVSYVLGMIDRSNTRNGGEERERKRRWKREREEVRGTCQ